jgi:hypothetical protein
MVIQMMHTIVRILLFISLVIMSTAMESLNAKPFYMYILAGQSNMEGLGLVEELPESLRAVRPEVYIYHANRLPDNMPPDDAGYWEALRPGHGSGYYTDGEKSNYSDKFGPELTFAARMRELDPSARIAIFKYAKGGASIHPDAAGDWGSWHPDITVGNGINQWDHFLHHLKRALSVRDIDGDGQPDTLIPAGILWLQGESDASFTKEIAESYPENLKYLITSMRRAVGHPDLPVVISTISESNMGEEGKVLKWGEIVQEAQRKFQETDKRTSVISPPVNHGWSDAWHYDSKTYLELGIRFAEAMHKLRYVNIFAKENLIAWCIVPYDAMNRNPEERARMLNELGITKFAWDWRERHLPELPAEIIALRTHGIELSAVWLWIDRRASDGLLEEHKYVLQTLEEYDVKTTLWVGINHDFFAELDDEERVSKGAFIIGEIHNRTKRFGSRVALYNHGDWFGEPENQIRIIRALDTDSVGIVYNFHHSHDQLDAYRESLRIMMPYLWTVNLNGMRRDGPKILDFGAGDREIVMIRQLKDSGFNGTIGIIGHTEGEDVRVVLERNLNGLKGVLKELGEDDALLTY